MNELPLAPRPASPPATAARVIGHWSGLRLRPRQVNLVAMRDFWAIVNTKSFLFGLLALLFIASVMPGVALLGTLRSSYRVGILDPVGPYAAGVPQRWEGKSDYVFEVIDLEGRTVAEARREAQEAVRKNRLFSLLEIVPGAAPGEEETFRISTSSLSDPVPDQELKATLAQVLQQERARRMGISRDSLAKLLAPPRRVETLQVTGTAPPKAAGHGDFIIAVALPSVLVFSMFGLISFQSERLLTALMEEKLKRLLEVLLTRASIYEILLGKMLGILYVGMLLYLGVALLIGIALAAFGYLHAVSFRLAAAYTMFYVVGYFLYGGFYAAIGASCNNPKDAENFSMPLRMLLMFPIMISVYVSRYPQSEASLFFSYCPLTAPFVMTNRVAVSSVPAWEIVLAVIVVFASGVTAIWIAARIFQMSLLAQGRRLRFKEIIRCLAGGNR